MTDGSGPINGNNGLPGPVRGLYQGVLQEGHGRLNQPRGAEFLVMSMICQDIFNFYRAGPD